jgi:hypothetical protein
MENPFKRFRKPEAVISEPEPEAVWAKLREIATTPISSQCNPPSIKRLDLETSDEVIAAIDRNWIENDRALAQEAGGHYVRLNR